MSGMLRKSYDIVSERHGIKGVLKDYGLVIKLMFQYMGRDVEIGLARPYKCDDKGMQEMGLKVLESYMDHLSVDEQLDRKLQLHNWYVDESRIDGVARRCAHGIVSGHKRLPDSIFIHTSTVMDIVIDQEAEEAVITTQNSKYHCPLSSCLWHKQDRTPEILPEYEWVKENYEERGDTPPIEDDKVLLVLSNYDEYYFNSLYYKPAGAQEKQQFVAYPHTGLVQDSFLINNEDESVDIRYFPHFQNIEFYVADTDGKPFFIENIGDVSLYVKAWCGLLRLEPGERKEVSKANVETEKPFLPDGDLYPAGVPEEETS